MAGTRSGPSWRRTSVRYREWAVAEAPPRYLENRSWILLMVTDTAEFSGPTAVLVL